MGQVIQLHQTTQGKAKGAGIAVAMMANRYGLDASEAREMGAHAKLLVEKGFSAAHARSVMLKRARRRARLSPPEAA